LRCVIMPWINHRNAHKELVN